AQGQHRATLGRTGPQISCNTLKGLHKKSIRIKSQVLEHQRAGFATPWGKNWFLLASQPQGGAPLTLGYYMQPPRGKNPNHRYSFAGRPDNSAARRLAT